MKGSLAGYAGGWDGDGGTPIAGGAGGAGVHPLGGDQAGQGCFSPAAAAFAAVFFFKANPAVVLLAGGVLGIGLFRAFRPAPPQTPGAGKDSVGEGVPYGTRKGGEQ